MTAGGLGHLGSGQSNSSNSGTGPAWLELRQLDPQMEEQACARAAAKVEPRISGVRGLAGRAMGGPPTMSFLTRRVARRL